MGSLDYVVRGTVTKRKLKSVTQRTAGPFKNVTFLPPHRRYGRTGENRLPAEPSGWQTLENISPGVPPPPLNRREIRQMGIIPWEVA